MDTMTPLPPAPDQDGWAICCSGGGIRSATYCLGALQSLDEGGLVGKARWILGISGGSYIAASRALVAHGLGDSQPRAYAPGTPEEQHLRDNTHYIAPDAKTVLVGGLSLLLGAMVTFVLAIAPLYAFSHAWGWLLNWRHVLTRTGPGIKMTASVAAWNWWLAPVVAAAVAVVLFLHWWATLPAGSPGRGSGRARWVGWAATVTAGLAIAMLVTPPLISWLSTATGPVGTIVHFFGSGNTHKWSPAAVAGLVAALTAVARACQRQLAKVTGPAAATAQPSGQLAAIGLWARQQLTPWLASAVIIAVGAAAALLWIAAGATAGFTLAQLWPVIAALAVMLATRIAADINRTSLHDFYRWRLAAAYAVTRLAAATDDPSQQRRLLRTAARTRLSDLRSDDAGPELVIGTTANINADGEVPAGRGGFCLTFDPAKVTLRGAPRCGEPAVEASTADYEHLVGHTRFTLFDVVAISGAAFSPLMGAATRSAYRILLTATNLRLGVWLPHPRVVKRARQYLDSHDEVRVNDSWWARRPGLLLLWYASPHPFWHCSPARQAEREDRLWAHVLRLREKSTRDQSRRARLRAALWWRAMQPTLGMLWAEAAGHTSYRATWINVTDGGHYDNLGLVEALRRGARNIVVLDASGDRSGTWYTLGGAIALARVDAGVQVSLNPTDMVRPAGSAVSLHSGEVVQPWAHGTFTRPNVIGLDTTDTGTGEPSAGRIWVCKLGWWQGASWDIRAYAAGHPTYPCDTTLQQMYDGAEFEAYHELGASAVLAAAQEGQLPLQLPLAGPTQGAALPPDVAHAGGIGLSASITTPQPRVPQPAEGALG
jgi:hypothetical protein